MALAFVASRGTGQSKTSNTALAVNPTATLAAGALVVVRAASDNFTTVNDAETTEHTVTDSKGNTWAKVKEKTKTSGVAADGITGSMWWSRITVAILTSDTVTLTLGNAVVAKTLAIGEYSATGLVTLAGSSITVINSTTHTTTIAALASLPYLFVGMLAAELPTPIGSLVVDSDYTATAEIGTTGGGATTNVAIAGGYRLLTGTGDVFNGTNANGDIITILAAFLESPSIAALAQGSNILIMPERA